MRNFLLFILIIVFISGFCVVSCPDKEAHKDAIMEKVNTLIDDEINNEVVEDEYKAIALFASSLASGISNMVIESRLSVENHFIFSVGKVTFDGEPHTVSLGILNHVFTGLNEDVRDALSDL